MERPEAIEPDDDSVIEITGFDRKAEYAIQKQDADTTRRLAFLSCSDARWLSSSSLYRDDCHWYLGT